MCTCWAAVIAEIAINVNCEPVLLVRGKATEVTGDLGRSLFSGLAKVDYTIGSVFRLGFQNANSCY